MSHDQAQTSLIDYVRVQVRYGCSVFNDDGHLDAFNFSRNFVVP